MELSKKEKDRIIAETKVRFEATQALEAQSGKKGYCRRGGFWRGLILGVLLTLLCGSVCRHLFGHHYYYGMGYGGGCPFSSCQTQSPADTPTK
jgi:hypothetical protein